jgi:hypothetical protein
MKKNLAIYLAILAFTLSFAGSGRAQFPDLINKAKDALTKKKDKNKDKTDNPQARAEQTNNSDQSSVGNNNSSASAATDQNKLLQVKPSAAGKIYFSDKPFGATNEGSKTSFTTGDYIYGRFETGGKTLRETFGFAPITKENPYHKLDFLIYVYSPTEYSSDGYETTFGPSNNGGFVSFTEADLDKTYWNFDVLPEPAKTTTILYRSIYDPTETESGGASAFYKFLKEFGAEKNYTVAIQLIKKTTDFRGNEEDEEKWLKVEGRLRLNFKAADFAKIKSDQEKMEAYKQARYSKNKADSKKAELEKEPLPKAWTLKSNPLLPGLTESNLRALYQQYGAHYTPKQIIKFYAAPYSSTARKVATNELGIPTHRTLDQWFTVFAKVKFDDGEESCFYQDFYAAEKYAGGGTYGNLILITQTRVDVSCAKLGVK